jgi:HlyD family secretion protein
MTRRRWIFLALLLLLGLGAAGWWLAREGGGAVQYRTARIERGSLQASVAASGTVTPVTQVQVGTQVSGQIKALFADFNSDVKAGQLLARIDPEAFDHKLRQVQADLDAARAAVLNAQANASAAQAAVSRALVDLGEAQRALQRNQELVAQNFISPAQLDTSRALVASQSAALKASQAQVQVAQAQIASAQASVKQREALVAQARIDVERTQIRSPVNGVVIKRSVELGQTVAASLQAPELFVIAQNLSDMQVQAAIDEADISRVKLDQKASFTVDAFPGRSFEGRVSQVRKSATNTQNVITYTVVVGFSNTEARLLPGMTANVRLVTDTRDNVLKLPNAALRVRIPGVEPPAASAVRGSPADAAQRPGDAPMRRAQAQGRSEGGAPQAGVAGEQQRSAQRAGNGESGRRQSTRGRIHLLEDGKPRAVDVRLGITDGTMTELIVPPNSPDAARLVEGAEVIVGTLGPGGSSAGAARLPAGPRMSF